MSSDIDRLTSLVNGLMLEKMEQGGTDPKKRKVSADRAAASAARVMAALEGPLPSQGRGSGGGRAGGRRASASSLLPRGRRGGYREEEVDEEVDEDEEEREEEEEERDSEEEEEEEQQQQVEEGGLDAVRALIKPEFGCEDGGVGLGELDTSSCSTDPVLAFDEHGHLFLSGPGGEDDDVKLAPAFDPFLGGEEEEEEEEQGRVSGVAPVVGAVAGGGGRLLAQRRTLR